jgi:hypothetical protein
VVRSDVRERGDANARWSVSWDPIGDFLMRTAMVPDALKNVRPEQRQQVRKMLCMRVLETNDADFANTSRLFCVRANFRPEPG